ncbi:MAG: MATE family efflux transporter [Bacteroidales bacterium]
MRFWKDKQNAEIFRLAFPNIVNNLSIPLVGIVDLALMGHLTSVKYLDAVAIGTLIFNFIYSGLSFLRMGTSGMTAQEYGAKNGKGIIQNLARSLSVAMGLAFVLIILQKPIGWVSLSLLDSSPEIESLAKHYFDIRIFAAPATLGLYALSGWFIGMQNSKFPMYIALVVNLFNIAANSLFIFVFGMNSNGVALGTLIAQYGGFFFALFLFWKSYRKHLAFFSWNNLWDLKAFKRFFSINSDIFIRSICLIFALSYFTAQSAKISDHILAVNTILFQFFLVFSYFIDGFAYAAEAIVGKEIGRKNYKSLTQTIQKLFLWGLIVSFPFTLFFLGGSGFFLSLLTNNKDIIEASKPYVIWSSIVPLLTFAAFIWDGIFVGATATKAMRNTLLISTFIIYLPACYFLQPIFGNHGLWIALLLFMAARGIALSFYSKNHIFNPKFHDKI